METVLAIAGYAALTCILLLGIVWYGSGGK